jgi:hypothetical protein
MIFAFSRFFRLIINCQIGLKGTNDIWKLIFSKIVMIIFREMSEVSKFPPKTFVATQQFHEFFENVMKQSFVLDFLQLKFKTLASVRSQLFMVKSVSLKDVIPINRVKLTTPKIQSLLVR